jgi:hypothetical protein
MISRAVKIAKRTSSSSSSNGGQHISITVEIFLQAILFLVVTNAMDSRYSFFVTLQVYFVSFPRSCRISSWHRPLILTLIVT